jgi:Mrp family chromosome partitioning ATPase
MALTTPVSNNLATTMARDVSARLLVTSPSCPGGVEEAYHTLLTNIDLALGLHEGHVVVVAAVDTTADAALVGANLALVAGQAGDRTLIVDADTQTPRLDALFGLDAAPGLAQLLADEHHDLRELARPTPVPSLGVVTAGVDGGRHSRLDRLGDLSAVLPRLKNVADRVIIVAPPVLSGTDVMRLGAYADGVLLVISPGKTGREKAARAHALLEKAHTPLLGAVLTPR